MNEKIEERCIYDVWCVTAKTPSGAKVMVFGKALEKARWAEPEPA